MIDTSDGLLADLGHVAQASGVAIDIATAALDLGEPLAAAARALTDQAPPFAAAPTMILSWVLTGGEDHSLVATFPPTVPLTPRWRVIGTVRPGPGPGVTVDGAACEGTGGWQHFR